ncbi:MAG: phospho-N-acetylmuramoyl-pentapeptide-transferase [Clostridiales bacterium]|nr:phospho-N-acetylmuramoyl-pentapeptide-transferase [Clostridiales bacterium]
MDLIYRVAGGSIAAFIITVLLLKFLPGEKALLGHDRGRLYAQGSAVNIGKPTGVGFYFTMTFALASAVTCYFSPSLVFFLFAIVASMMTGFLDDRSEKAWNEYIKGFLDFIMSLTGALLCVMFYGSNLIIGLTGTTIHLHPAAFYVLAVILFVVSINATNATDGIDGLSGSLTILSIATLFVISAINTGFADCNKNGLISGLIMIAVLLAYLIFNFNPSKMLMGDAGSRALGFFIAYYAIYLKIPFAYLIVGLPFICDGGISIFKITVGRLTKKKIIPFKHITTPLHDELRKNRGFNVRKVWTVLVLCALAIDIVYTGITLILHMPK